MQVFELDKDLGRPSYSGIPFFKTIRPLILAEHLSEAQFFQSVSAINNAIAYRMQAIRAVRLFFIFAALGCFIGLFVMVAQVNQPRFPLVFIFPLLMMFCLLIALMVGNWWLKQCIQRVGILLEELTRESGGRLMWRHEFRIGTKYAPGVNSIRIEFLSNPMPNIQAQQHFAVGQLTQMSMPASAPFYSAPRQEEIAPSNPPTYVEAVHEVDVVISTDKPMSCENQAVSNGQYLDNSSEGVVNAVTHDKIHDACRYEGEA